MLTRASHSIALGDEPWPPSSTATLLTGASRSTALVDEPRAAVETGFVVPFDPEVFKLTALELLGEAGVRFHFHALASDVLPGRQHRDRAHTRQPLDRPR